MEFSEFQLELLDKINNNTSSGLSWLVEDNYHHHAKFIEVLNLIKYLEDVGAIAFKNGGFFFVTNDLQRDIIELTVSSYGLTDPLMDVYRKLRNNDYTKTSKLRTIMKNSKGSETIIKKIEENTQVNKKNGKSSFGLSLAMLIVGILALGVSIWSMVKTSNYSDDIKNIKEENQQLIKDKNDIENRLLEIEYTIINDSLGDFHAIR